MTDSDAAREELLASVWAEIRALSADNVRNFPAATRAIDAGASVEDVVCAMTAAAYETAFTVFELLSATLAVPDADPPIAEQLQGAS